MIGLKFTIVFSVSIVSCYFYLVLYFLYTVCSLDSILICLFSLPLTNLKLYAINKIHHYTEIILTQTHSTVQHILMLCCFGAPLLSKLLTFIHSFVTYCLLYFSFFSWFWIKSLYIVHSEARRAFRLNCAVLESRSIM